jgi:class 3 adenylate cyclase
MQMYLAMLSCCALVLGIVVGLVLSRPIAQPLVALADVARDVERGNYSVDERLRAAYRRRLEARDEIGVLARAFVDMLAGLREKLAMSKLMSQAAYARIQQIGASESDDVSSQRRVMAVLFSDVRGFSSFSERRDPGEVIAVVNQVLSMQAEIIRQHGGDIDRFVGDQVIAWFSGERACEHAALAAAEIRQQLSKHLRGAPGTNVGFGLHYGEVVLGFLGNEARRDYTAIGSVVNLAARLCAAAQAGQLLVSKVVADQLRHTFELRSVGKLALKGFSESVDVWETVLEFTPETVI